MGPRQLRVNFFLTVNHCCSMMEGPDLSGPGRRFRERSGERFTLAEAFCVELKRFDSGYEDRQGDMCFQMSS